MKNASDNICTGALIIKLELRLEYEEGRSAKERIQWENNIKYEKKNDIDIVKDIEKRQTNTNFA